MGDLAEDFALLRKINSIERQTKDEYYSAIMEQLGAKCLNACTWRLGEYNIYTSKGFVMHKSNRGAKHDLAKWLKEKYGVDANKREMYKKMYKELAKEGIHRVQ